jgi:hypothetical protein
MFIKYGEFEIQGINRVENLLTFFCGKLECGQFLS